ncbi:aminomethyl-transferring glycine dehydrogenase subunit GcvPB [Fretibacterium sp. OH1220_COT-178]|uniref:aminomethyl-transferring glycine dehydrogenase subunit GcvPB n=1 Tax=Fretibacterium sp. OH1220_COT-178 TaxID=2491047 RepID=UPI000F5ED469|nr:aminomethyl-transferring glycine dehydrogenase subunit GcvPB [Fretibacterium sp. OH1220_COT-178]RRD64532.1 glycine dehydrogenase subunit 2 [Fretibacterium sp. OH1220_COT-178]
MSRYPGTKGLAFKESLLWERASKGRMGISVPSQDVPESKLDASLTGPAPKLPELSEVDVIRHYTRLSTWNFGVDTGMYPLGSCTMKYNPKINDRMASLPGFANVHPLMPEICFQGALKAMYELEQDLLKITGMKAASLQPSAGAQGELTGMLMIHAYHAHKGRQRKKVIMPSTAHGTNPASAALCGYEPVPVELNKDGVVTPDAIREIMDEDTAGIMLTNPNTLGIFEHHVAEISKIIHEKGGLVYGDGANMNALMGYVDVHKMGVDVLHLNVHKTLSTPHGGGGPGAGPVVVGETLEPFLPVPRICKEGDRYTLCTDSPLSIGRLQAFFGNFAVLVRALAYTRTMGHDLKAATEAAVLNANYIKACLKGVYNLPFPQDSLHEVIFNDAIQQKNGVTTLDIAKRLIDCGYHPPTVYFPLVVDGAIMIEPTDTESKNDLDGFIDAMKAIAEEAKSNPEMVTNTPQNTMVARPDETLAARNLVLKGE